jgi:hypothetical protein
LSVAFRKFGEESIQFLGKKISIETSDKKTYSGTLIGIIKMIINGSFIKEIRLMEKPFDLKALADRFSRVFPGLVKLREDVRAIIVMDKIKVTQNGIEEGTGLAADRIKAIYDEFIRETKK